MRSATRTTSGRTPTATSQRITAGRGGSRAPLGMARERTRSADADRARPPGYALHAGDTRRGRSHRGVQLHGDRDAVRAAGVEEVLERLDAIVERPVEAGDAAEVA